MIAVGFAFAMAMMFPAPLPPDHPACAISPDRRAVMMAADHDAFDQSTDGEASWRGVMGSGCYETAAGLVEAWLQQHRGALSPDQVREVTFHIGQIFGFGGMEARAAPWFEAAGAGGDAEWMTYVESQLAFVRRDRAAFDAARTRYAQIAPTSGRRVFLDGEAACFDRPFAEAVMCPAAAPAG